LELSFGRLLLFSALTVLLGVGLVYGLSYEFKPKNSTQMLSSAEGVNEQVGLELTLTLQKTEYSLGEPVNVTLTITDVENQTVSFSNFISWWDFLVYNGTVFGQNGLYQWRLDSGEEMPMHGEYITLDPGMSLTNVFVWPQTCNATLSPDGVPVSPVSPGTYYIVGRYDYFGHSFDYNLQTTPIQITIAPP
jgi:hypothetical protein